MLSVKDSREKEILEKFKTKTKDLNQDDVTLLRFLRAREHNLDKAEDMIRKSMRWREENDISSLVDWTPPKAVAEEFEYAMTDYDFEGRPVFFLPMGKWDGRHLLNSGLKADVIKFGRHLNEVILKAIKDSKADQAVFLYDMTDLSMWKMTHYESMQLLYKGFQELEVWENYPEIVDSLLYVNAPWIFSFGFNFVKPILSERTISKMKVFNSDKGTWLPALLEKMPREAIPKSLLL